MNTIEGTISEEEYSKQRMRGLFARAQRMAGTWVAGLFYLWFLSVWVLEFFTHPGYILGFGILYAIFIGMTLGMGTLNEEGDEMLFLLPNPRTNLFWVSAFTGGVPLLLMCLFGVLALKMDAPQAVWGIFVDSGFTTPYPKVEFSALWSWAVMIPLFLYACLFSFSQLSRTRGGALPVLIISLLLTGGVLLGGVLLENWIWKETNGSLTSPFLCAGSVLILWLGGNRFRLKEAYGVQEGDMAGRRNLWIWLVLAVFLLFVFFNFMSFSVESPSEIITPINNPSSPQPLQISPSSPGE